MITLERLNDSFSIGEILQKQYGMSERQPRELPKIELGDTMFYLDLRLNEFREVADFSNRINLNELKAAEDGYLIILDTKAKNLFKGDLPELFKRKDEELIWELLPSLQQMDPLGCKWLIDEYRQGTAIAVTKSESMAFREYENNQIERALNKAKPLKTKLHPTLLEKKYKKNKKGRKL